MSGGLIVFLTLLGGAVFLLSQVLIVPAFGSDARTQKLLRRKIQQIAAVDTDQEVASLLREKYLRELSPLARRLEDSPHMEALGRVIEQAGVPCPVVTGAGTGTWQLERDSHVYTELQPGSYVFMDADYGRNALARDDHAFEHSLYVLATVMSTPAPERAIVDAGLKALAFDSGLPLVHAAHGLDYVKASDEHGVLAVDTARAAPAPGDRIWLIPGHCDPTVNLYDWIVGMRGERVECVWSVAARGAVG